MNNLTYDDTLKNIVDKVNQNNSELSTKSSKLDWKIMTDAVDLNTMITDGRYLLKGTITNGYTGASGWHYLIVESIPNNNRVTQIIWHDDGTEAYTRRLKSDGTWTSWLLESNTSNAVSVINQSIEGIKISADKVDIDGLVNYNNGNNAITNRIGEVETDINNRISATNQKVTVNSTNISNEVKRATDKENELNTSINELNSKIDTTNTRINNLVGNTGDSNTEIVDARVGFDNTTYKTLGEAIRTQIGILNDGGLNMKEDFIGKQVNNWLSEHPEATTTVQDGSITRNKLINELEKTTEITFDSVYAMKECEYLKDGNYVKTSGYYNVNDGGGALYRIASTKPNKYYETINNGLYALLIVNDFLNVKVFGAKGDGSNDDTDFIQKAIDYAYSNRLGSVFVPSGSYKITKPIVLWSRYKEYENINDTFKSVSLIGENKDTTHIVKDGTEKSNLNDHNVDAIIIVANDNYTDSSFSSNHIESGYDTKCFHTIIKNLTLRSNTTDYSTRIHGYGIYTQCFYWAKIENLIIRNCDSCVYSYIPPVLSHFNNFDLQFPLIGIDFGNSLLTGTTCEIRNVHVNGPVKYAFSLQCHTTLINCSVDGGTATGLVVNAVYRNVGAIRPKVVAIQFHYESPSSQNIVTTDGCNIKFIKSSFEVQSQGEAGKAFVLKKHADISFDTCSISIRFGATAIGKLYSLENSSIHFENCIINPFIFNEYQLLYGQYKKRFLDKYNINSVNIISPNDTSGQVTRYEDHIKTNIDENENVVVFDFGKMDLTELQTIKVYANVNSIIASSNVRIWIFDSYGHNKMPYNPTIFEIGMKANGEQTILNYTTDGISQDLQADVSNVVGEKYIALEIGPKSINVDVYGVYGI